MVRDRFTHQYSTTYATLANHVFYKLYCVEAMFSKIEKRASALPYYDKTNEDCINTSGNICLWFTVTFPTIKMAAVIIRALKTGNFFEAIDTIL